MRISDWSSDVCSSDLGQPRKNREQSASAWFRTPTPCLWNDTIRIPLTSYALGPVDRSSKFVALFRLQSRRCCGHLELLAPVADARQHAIAIGGRHQGVVELGPVRRCQARMSAGFAGGFVKLETIHHLLQPPLRIPPPDPDP